MITQTARGYCRLDLAAPPDPNRTSILSRVPARSFCHMHEIPLADAAVSSLLDSRAAPDAQPHQADVRIRVARFPSSSRGCRHLVFAERGAQLKKLDLPATSRVEIRQRFQAQAGDRLSFDCVLLLKSGPGCNSAAAKVHAVLANIQTQTADSLLHRTVGNSGPAAPQLIGSNIREAVLSTIPVAGYYELRTATSIDPTCPGAEAHLLVDRVRVVNSLGIESVQLASLSCVGRVRW
jgi:hypothetical protein